MRAAASLLSRPLGEGGWLGSGDVVLGGTAPPASEERRPTSVVAWCPTPRALAIASEAGLELLGPPAEVLIKANARETFAGVDPLPGTAVCGSKRELRAALEGPPLARSGAGPGRSPAWVLRRSLGCAGSGRLLTERWDVRTEAWADGALADGPIEVQPAVDIVDEYSVHGQVHPAGAVSCAAPLQWRRGPAWPAGGGAPDLSAAGLQRLLSCGEEVGRALAQLGYFGPFGVDGFRWSGPDGDLRLQVGTDVNARLTLHFGRGAPGLLPSSSGHQEHLT